TMIWPALRKKATWLAPYDYGGTTPGGNVVFWNGDDAISLQKKQTNGNWKDIDIFGEIGVRPLDWQLGTTGAWTDTKPYWRGTGAYLTKDQTLIRKHTISYGIDRFAMNQYGDSITSGFPNSFNAFAEYDSMPSNFFDSLGFHYCSCSVIQAGNNGPVCEGSLLSLFILNVLQGATFSWTGPNNFTSSLQSPIVSSQAALSMAGIYFVTVYSNGVFNTYSTIVSVIQAPATPGGSNNGPICYEATLLLNASTIPNASYSWSGPNGFTSLLQNPIIMEATTLNSGKYFVKAISSSGCSSPTDSTLVVVYQKVPETALCMVSVDSLTGKNLIIWNKSVTTAINHFNIYLEGAQVNQYNLIGVSQYNSLSIFSDTNSNPAQQPYRYKISAFDICGTEKSISTSHKTIHLTISQGMGNSYNLIWSNYEGFAYQSYNLYRGINPLNLSLLTTVALTTNSYTDLSPPFGNVYYQIEVLNPSPCFPSRTISYNSSKSNIASNAYTAIPAIDNSENINLYPNPSYEKIIIEFSNYSLAIETNLELIRADGLLMKNQLLNGFFNQIDISSFPNGVYFAKIRMPKSVIVRKFIKQ
ncbi:MAG: T9SS type A sorting domain-containing protein, partial [Bacteroidota bacterium]